MSNGWANEKQNSKINEWNNITVWQSSRSMRAHITEYWQYQERGENLNITPKYEFIGIFISI